MSQKAEPPSFASWQQSPSQRQTSAMTTPPTFSGAALRENKQRPARTSDVFHRRQTQRGTDAPMMQGRRDTIPLTSESEPIGGRAALCRDHNVMNDIFQRFAILMPSPSSGSRRLSMVGEKTRVDVLSWTLPVLAISFISGSIMSRARQGPWPRPRPATTSWLLSDCGPPTERRRVVA